MNPLILMEARAKFYNCPHDFEGYLSYIRAHRIDTQSIGGFAGATKVVDAVDHGGGRFDFQGHGPKTRMFVCEAFGADGETVVDLVAWPIGNPTKVLSLFGKAGLVGMWEAANPSTYIFDTPLNVHRTPLDWLKAGCRGAAIVTPHVAARLMLDLPGKFAAQDYQHGRELKALIESVVPKNRVVVPAFAGRAAA